ncbi:integrase core domain-containing protein [Billgrantia endophytica]|uniref:Integrase catalytic domain-containing protein n=1 Tax=Billgrantia endophytica TaxID=2033802 RepID=A0A2N7UE45_9GAMM|nr:hypothetical protein C1H69_00145 [Halomonas endophytica]
MPDTHWFLSLGDACYKIEAWRQDHNQIRPHSSLGWLTPTAKSSEFPMKIGPDIGRGRSLSS